MIRVSSVVAVLAPTLTGLYFAICGNGARR